MQPNSTFYNALSGLPDPQSQAGFYADVPFKRLMAWVIDGALTFALTFLISLFTLGIGFFFFFFIWAVLGFAYRFITIAGRSATIGMRLMGIELRTGTGQRFDGMQALLHTAGTTLCFATGVQFISVILMVVTARGQGLPDMILGTAMVNNKARY